MVFPAQETYFETFTLEDKGRDFQSLVLVPQDSTFYASYMNSSRWFQLSISSRNSSGDPSPVKLTVSVIKHTGGATKVPLPGYPQTKSDFNQKVLIFAMGTYWIDIENVNSFSVTLNGDITVQQTKEGNRTIYPYVIPGFLIMIVGAGIVIYGIFKRPSKPKRAMVKKVKR